MFRTECDCLRRRALVQVVYANNLVVGTGGKVSTVGGEAHGVDRAKVVAHVAELARTGKRLVVGLVDRFGGPDSNVAICSQAEHMSE